MTFGDLFPSAPPHLRALPLRTALTDRKCRAVFLMACVEKQVEGLAHLHGVGPDWMEIVNDGRVADYLP